MRNHKKIFVFFFLVWVIMINFVIKMLNEYDVVLMLYHIYFTMQYEELTFLMIADISKFWKIFQLSAPQRMNFKWWINVWHMAMNVGASSPTLRRPYFLTFLFSITINLYWEGKFYWNQFTRVGFLAILINFFLLNDIMQFDSYLFQTLW